MSMQNDTEGRKQEEEVETVATEAAPQEAESDVVSDPARDDKVGSDWADEGGATPDRSADQVD